MYFQRKTRHFSEGIHEEFPVLQVNTLSHLSIVINLLSTKGLRKLLEWAFIAPFTERQQFMILSEQNKTEVCRPSISLAKKITLKVYSRDMHISQDTFLRGEEQKIKFGKK